MNLLISAGEASGELYGGQIIEAVRARIPEARFFGTGGKRMQEAGCELIVDAREIAVMGITEVVRHIPRIYVRYKRMVAELDKRRPAAAILIDFPDYNLRLATECKKRGIPVIYFVSPQVWAWKKGRIVRMKRDITKLLVIFPFEVPFFRKHGMDVEFVGHPLADVARPELSREQYAQAYSLDFSRTWIAMLPGSRRKEVKLNFPVMLEAAAKLGGDFEYLIPVATTLSRTFIGQYLNGLSDSQRQRIHFVDDARMAMHFARASVVASGTATVEAALVGNPYVIVYRLSDLSYRIAKRAVDLENVGMVNLIAGRRIVPELIQQEFTAEAVAKAISPLLAESPERQTMLADLAAIRQQLQPTTHGQTAVGRAADAIVATVREAQSVPVGR